MHKNRTCHAVFIDLKEQTQGKKNKRDLLRFKSICFLSKVVLCIAVFKRAENILVRRSVNFKELRCQNIIKTIWSPFYSTFLWSQPLSKLWVVTLLRLRLQRPSIPLRFEITQALCISSLNSRLAFLFNSLYLMKNPLATHSINCHSITVGCL